jgi:DNA-binding MarR family transcriptional regulator
VVSIEARRKRTDRLFPPAPLSRRQREAAELVRARPGISVEELAEALGVGVKRAWQLLDRLEARGHVRRQPAGWEPPRT